MAELTFIDMFSGCGGMALGLLKAKWRGLLAIEKNPMAFRTLKENLITKESTDTRLNWPTDVPCEPLAIEDLLAGGLSRLMRRYRDGIDLLSGGPPCQGFSFSGKRKQNDSRNRLIEIYAHLALELRPKLLLLENVPGIQIPHGTKRQRATNPRRRGRPRKSYAQKLAELLEEEYLFFSGIIDAADFGVPQHRRRYFGVGIRRSLLPHPTIASKGRAIDKCGIEFLIDPFQILEENRLSFLRDRKLNLRVSAEDAIGDLSSSNDGAHETTRWCLDPESPKGFLELAYVPSESQMQTAFVCLMRHRLNGDVPDSLRLARHSSDVKKRFSLILDNCPKGVQLSNAMRAKYSTEKQRIIPLCPHKPAHTLTTLPDDLIHYKFPRTLTVREYARLQSFPDDFKFVGKYTTGGKQRRYQCPRYTQVGNAVPPLMAEAWGLTLARLLKLIES